MPPKTIINKHNARSAWELRTNVTELDAADEGTTNASDVDTTVHSDGDKVKSEELSSTDVDPNVHSEGDSAKFIESKLETSSCVLSDQSQPMPNGVLSPQQSQSQLERPQQFQNMRNPLHFLF